jgi:hypothetical protein
MAKLPDNFVKAPAETSRVTTAHPAGKPAGKPVGKEVRRKARRGELQPPVDAADAHSVVVRLSPEEHQALSAACEALAAAGETVTIEDMIRKVVERWITATRAAAAPEHPTPAPAAPPRAIAAIRTQLRRLAEQPIRRWRALQHALRRWSHALAG